ncbi:MAG: carbohydrate kinase family protein [Patescibacteria group bacterium]
MFSVLTIGTATRDTFLTSPLFKVLHDPKHLKKLGFKTGEAQCFALGAKIDVGEPMVTVGGGAANAAVTFARQGLTTGVLVRLGDDENGSAIARSLARERIRVIPVASRTEKTAHSTILLTPGGERTILTYRGASGGMEAREVPFRKLAARWAYLVPGGIPLAVLMKIVAHLKSRGTRLAMNPSKTYLALGKEKLKPLLATLDVVIVNREEASYLTGVEYRNARGIFKQLDGLVPGIAVMTDGARGSLVSDGKYLYTAGIFREKKLVDRTGAGDAFGAGFVAGLVEKNDISYALRLAAANATAVVETIGAQAGILSKRTFADRRWRYLDLDVDPL